MKSTFTAKTQKRRTLAKENQGKRNLGSERHPVLFPKVLVSRSLLRVSRFCGEILFLLGVLGGTVAAEDKPEFSLIGDVSQKVAYTSTDWGYADATAWTFQTNLRPQFTYGKVSFTADTAWYLPLTASLTPDVPKATVYEAYFRVTPVESLDLTFGQKHYNLGVGQIFTVGDTINPAISFFDQKTGFKGATAEWSPASWVSVSGAYSTGVRPDQGVAAGQVSALLDQWQLTASAVGGKSTLNPGAGLSYDLFGVILTAEGAAEFRPAGEPMTTPKLSGSTGARYTATLTDDWDLTVAGQYLDWANAGARTNPEARGIAHSKNAFLQVQASAGTVFALATLVGFDLEDNSVLHQTVLTWTPWDNVDFVATVQTAKGDEGTVWEFLGPPPARDRYLVSLATTYHF